MFKTTLRSSSDLTLTNPVSIEDSSPNVLVEMSSGLTARKPNEMTSGIEMALRNADYADSHAYCGDSVNSLVRIKKFGKMKHDIWVAAGEGVYRELIDGTAKKLYKQTRHCYQHTKLDSYDILTHSLVFFMTVNDAFKNYMANDNLVINHCVIHESGCVTCTVDPYYLELVSYRMNTLHGKFIKKWGLYGVPVSAFDVVALDDLFTQWATIENCEYLGTREGYAITEEMRRGMQRICNVIFRYRTYPLHSWDAEAVEQLDIVWVNQAIGRIRKGYLKFLDSVS